MVRDQSLTAKVKYKEQSSARFYFFIETIIRGGREDDKPWI